MREVIHSRGMPGNESFPFDSLRQISQMLTSLKNRLFDLKLIKRVASGDNLP
ncbi:MAG: hypothetical protein RL693_917 [Verrucomicrobiota bacterium]